MIENELKKETLKIQKSEVVISVLNQSPHSTIFAMVRFPGSTKLVQLGDPLYNLINYGHFFEKKSPCFVLHQAKV